MSFDSVKIFNTIRNLETAKADAFSFLCGHLQAAPAFIKEHEEDFLACLERREEVWGEYHHKWRNSSGEPAEAQALEEEEQKLLREIDDAQRLIEDSINQKMGTLSRRIARLTASLRLNNYQLYRRL